jgi:hypothetical protein
MQDYEVAGKPRAVRSKSVASSPTFRWNCSNSGRQARQQGIHRSPRSMGWHPPGVRESDEEVDEFLADLLRLQISALIAAQA